MSIQKTGAVSFSGIRLPEYASVENAAKLNKFLSNPENTELIKDLESNYNTDVLITKNFDKVKFIHGMHGDLAKYGATTKDISEFSEDSDYIKLMVSNAVKRVTEAWKSLSRY